VALADGPWGAWVVARELGVTVEVALDWLSELVAAGWAVQVEVQGERCWALADGVVSNVEAQV